MRIKAKRKIGGLHPSQSEVYDVITRNDPPKISVLACGARWGKDRLCLMLLLHIAKRLEIRERERRRRENLVPRVLCWYVAPTFALLRQAWDEITAFAGNFPGIRLNRSSMRVFLPGGVQIEFKSADNPGRLLARGLDLVICTESARMKREAWESAIMTRLSSPGRGPRGRGGIAILNSTPNGKNWFWEFYNIAKNNPKYKAWNYTSFDNPLISREVLDEQRQMLPERVFRQEYLAEFLENGGSVFRRVSECLKVYDYPGKTDARVTIGIDWGRYNDRTAAVAIASDAEGYRVVGHLLLINTDYDEQIRRIKAFADSWHNSQIIAEANSLGDPLIHALKKATGRRVIPFTTTATSKRQIVDSAATIMEQGGIILPGTKKYGLITSAAQELTDELSQYEVTSTPGGHIGYSAPAGLHDDLVMAFCFALSGKEIARISGRITAV